MEVKKTLDLLLKGAGTEKIPHYLEQYPYYAPLHFFHLATQTESAEQDPKLTGKAEVYFNNPFLLKLRLSKMRGAEHSTPPAIQTISEKTDTPLATEELLFEPLHTTDYFASQGIKLSQEVQSGDKFGQQLRSFTDWLKSMKKLPQTQVVEQVPIDSQVTIMAEKSNEEGDVLTESMAEVLIEQGKFTRAIEIYRKLSLLNPAKNTYFAGKIDSLKGK